jgi:3-hydroxyacyl-[acyl-carrier-protein] dehydratase
MRLEYFRMLDRLEEIGPGMDEVRFSAHVPKESVVFEGHFPGFPIMPGVLLLETMAQASGYMLVARNGGTAMPFFAGVRRGKFRTFVNPGEILEVRAKIMHEGSGFAVTSAEILIDGKKTCESELTLSIAPFPSDVLRVAFLAEAERIGVPIVRVS